MTAFFHFLHSKLVLIRVKYNVRNCCQLLTRNRNLPPSFRLAHNTALPPLVALRGGDCGGEARVSRPTHPPGARPRKFSTRPGSEFRRRVGSLILCNSTQQPTILFHSSFSLPTPPSFYATVHPHSPSFSPSFFPSPFVSCCLYLLCTIPPFCITPLRTPSSY